MYNSAFLLSALLAACSPISAGGKEAEMLERLLIGSDYNKNHKLLSDNGWLHVFGNSCDNGKVNDKKHLYVRGVDPSYSLVLIYNRECKLESRFIRKREVNEL